MTHEELHALAEKAAGWIPAGRLNHKEWSELVGAVERALAKLQEAHEEERTAAAVAEALEKRDRDWILAMGHALGLDSGYKVPIVPEVAPFKELFDSLKPRTDLVCKHEHTDVSQPNMDDADYRVECKDCGKVWWHDGPDA